MLDDGVIERANSEWAAPVFIVSKKHGSLRFCFDYRKLNDLTVKDSYPLSRIDECLDTLGHAKVFTTLDANSGYWQIYLWQTKTKEKLHLLVMLDATNIVACPLGFATHLPPSREHSTSFCRDIAGKHA